MKSLTTIPSLREVLADIFRNLRLIILLLIIPPVIAGALAMALPKVYRADAKLLIKSGREFIPTTSNGQSDQGAPQSSMDEIVKSETEILNSDDLAQDVLTKLTIPVVFPDLNLESGSSVPPLERAITTFGKQLQVNPIELSNVVGVSFDSKDPEVAQKVLGTLLHEFQALHVTLYSNSQAAPLEAQIAAKQKELEDLDSQRIQFQNANGAFSIPDQRSSLIQQRAQLGALLQDAEIRNSALQEQVSFLKKSRTSTPQTIALDSQVDPSSPNSSAALTQLMALRQKEQELLQHYQPSAPAVIQLRAQIAQAEQFVQSTQTDKNTTSVRSGANPLLSVIDQQLLTAQAELTPISVQITGYKSQMASIDDELRKLQESELQVNNLQRQIDSQTADLQALRSSLDQARLAENMDQAKVSSVAIIDAPRIESQAVFPKKVVFVAGGLGFGIALSALVILLSLSFGNTIITVEGAERILGTPVVAALPRMKALPAE